MAILKKGILGTPKGKIGQIMGYSRNGKGIIQRVPTVINKEKRYWNLAKTLLIEQLTSLWNQYNASIQNLWTPYTEGSESAYDAYIRVNVAQASLTYSRDISGLIARPAIGLIDYGVKGNLNDSNTELKIAFPDNYSFYNGSSLFLIVARYFKTSGAIGGQNHIISDFSSNVQTIVLNAQFDSTVFLVTYEIRRNNPTLGSSWFMASPQLLP